MGETSGPLGRRGFLAASVAAGAVAMANSANAQNAGSEPAKTEFYELRRYELRMGAMQQHMDKYLQNAFIPAMQRQGLGPVGVFSVLVGPKNPSLYVLVPHPSFESIAASGAKLAADEEYQKANELKKLPATDAPYANYARSLHKAVEFMPKLEPAPGGTQKPRIFELRVYRSHGRTAAVKKAEMFSPVGGELALFRRVGLTPVFFADSVFGEDLPNLTYMLTYPDLATREKNWATFAADPEWKKLSSTPGYTNAEIVSSINNVLLRPTAYSQI